MQRYSAISREGFWLLVANAIAAVFLARYVSPLAALPSLIPMVLLLALFRDPERDSPLAPLAILAPVDGKITRIAKTRSGLLEREALVIEISINPFGAYTLRSPVEGKILDPYDNAGEGSRLTGRGGLWLRLDEGDDVVVTFRGGGFFGLPKSLRRYGERVGQGHRCAFLRLARRCQMYLPADARPRVEVGERILAGVTPLAERRPPS